MRKHGLLEVLQQTQNQNPGDQVSLPIYYKTKWPIRMISTSAPDDPNLVILSSDIETRDPAVTDAKTLRVYYIGGPYRFHAKMLEHPVPEEYLAGEQVRIRNQYLASVDYNGKRRIKIRGRQ